MLKLILSAIVSLGVGSLAFAQGDAGGAGTPPGEGGGAPEKKMEKPMKADKGAKHKKKKKEDGK